MSDERYNGWTNWETWKLYDWATNDCKELAAEHGAEHLALILKRNHEMMLEEIPKGWHRDVLSRAILKANWLELAEELKG